jgi:glycosyltransferase involved in cell wall biosynthesis
MSDIVFVVIGRNEGGRLRECLESVLAVSTQAIYADSGSSDGSAELARRLGFLVVELTSPPFTAARGRNEGFAEARKHFGDARFVQFLDGDCVLEPSWPQFAAEFLRDHPDVGVVCGRRYEANPDASFYNLVADSEWNTPIGPSEACGGDSMMRVEALEGAGGFDPTLMAGEEPELCARLRARGWTVWRLDRLMSEHDANIMRFGQWWTRTVRSGFGYAQVWHVSRKASRPLPAPQLRSSLLWVVLMPLAVLIAALIFHRPVILTLILVGYGIQLVRIANRRRGPLAFRFRSSALLMIGKIAELVGAVRYVLTPRDVGSFEYKRNVN